MSGENCFLHVSCLLNCLLLDSFFNFDIFYSFKTSLTEWLSVRLRSKWLGGSNPDAVT